MSNATLGGSGGNGGGGGLASLLNDPEWFDDFLFNTGESGEIGELGWHSSTRGGSIGSTNFSDHPGIVTVQTGSTTSGRASILSYTNAMTFGYGQVTVENNLSISALSDGTNTFKVYAGIYDNTSMSNSGEGIYFSYTHGENSGNWTINTSTAGGVNTTADSGVAPVAFTFQSLKFVCNADSSSVEFFIDGVSVGVITTTIPSTADPTTPFFGIIKSAGTSSRILYVDAFYAKYALTNPRFS